MHWSEGPLRVDVQFLHSWGWMSWISYLSPCGVALPVQIHASWNSPPVFKSKKVYAFFTYLHVFPCKVFILPKRERTSRWFQRLCSDISFSQGQCQHQAIKNNFKVQRAEGIICWCWGESIFLYWFFSLSVSGGVKKRVTQF